MPNTATSFREAVAENTRDVFLGQGHFEETVVYKISDNDPGVSMVVLASNVDGGLDRETHHLSDLRQLRILTAADPVIVNADQSRTSWAAKLGKAYDPGLGHWFKRADGSDWSFVRIVQSGFAGWTLIFKTQKILRAGHRPIGL